MGWFNRLIGREQKPGAAAPATDAKPAPAKPASDAKPAPAPPAKAAPSAPTKPAAPAPEPINREQILEALQLKMPETPPPPADVALTNRVAEEFRKTRPVPASPPQLAMRILNLIAQPETEPAELAKLITLDPALTAALLRVAGSAAYRTVEKVDNLRDAITRLGMREVANICCALSSKSVFDPDRRAAQAQHGPIFRELFVHATTSAMAAASLALSLSKVKTRSDSVFLSGLLHDIGMSVGMSVLAGLVAQEKPSRTLGKEEVWGVLDAVHTEIGGEIHKEWQLPETALQICVGHHLSNVPATDYSNELHVVRLTSAIHLLHSRMPTEARLLEVEESARALGLTKFSLRSFDGDLQRFTGIAQQLGG